MSRTVSELKQASYAGGSVAVSLRCALPGCRVACSRRAQILACALTAIFCAVFFALDYRLLLWRLKGEEDVEGDRIWKDLRKFCGWSFAGCVAGVAAFSLNMEGRSSFFESLDPSVTRRRSLELLATFLRYNSAFNFFEPLLLLCCIYAFNTMLRRVSDHASHPYYNTARDLDARPTATQRNTDINTRSNINPLWGKQFDWRDYFGQYNLYNWVRSIEVIAMVLCSMNVLARIVAVGYRADQVQQFDQAGAVSEYRAEEAWLVDQAAIGAPSGYYLSLRHHKTSFLVSLILEAAVLVFEACSFLLFFPASIVLFGRVERKLDIFLRELSLRSDQGTAFLPFEFSPPAKHDRNQTQTEMPIIEAREYLRDIKLSAAVQRRRFFLCLVLVTFSLVLESAHASLIAFIQFGDRNPACHPCNPCQSLIWIVEVWYSYTPELLPLVISLRTTLPLVFSLWLMTTPEDRALLMAPHRFRTSSVSMNPVQSARDAQQMEQRIRLGIYLQ